MGFPRFQRYVAAACVVVAVFLSVSLYIGIKIGQPEMAQQTYSNWGGKSEVALPDGSNVWIHSATSLTYNTNYYSKNRNVRLNGEAYFDVAHDKDHPFVVETEGMKITVHGTKIQCRILSRFGKYICQPERRFGVVGDESGNPFSASGRSRYFQQA